LGAEAGSDFIIRTGISQRKKELIRFSPGFRLKEVKGRRAWRWH
jgi:hypothetical protein